MLFLLAILVTVTSGPLCSLTSIALSFRQSNLPSHLVAAGDILLLQGREWGEGCQGDNGPQKLHFFFFGQMWWQASLIPCETGAREKGSCRAATEQSLAAKTRAILSQQQRQNQPLRVFFPSPHSCFDTCPSLPPHTYTQIKINIRIQRKRRKRRQKRRKEKDSLCCSLASWDDPQTWAPLVPSSSL